MRMKGRSPNLRVAKFWLALLLSVASAADAKERDGIKEMKEQLISGKPREQVSAMEALAGKGVPAIEALCEIIESVDDRGAKNRATQVLEQIFDQPTNRTSKALERLGKLLEHKDRTVVGSAASAMMHFKKNSRARDLLKRGVERAKNDDAKVTLLGAVTRVIDGDKAEIPYLEGFLKDESKAVRIWTAGYLGTLGSSAGLDECRQVLSLEPADDATRTLQMRAAIAAGRIGDPSLIPQLARVGASDAYGIASRSARAAIREIRLAQMKTLEHKVEFLKNALTDEDSVRWAISHLMAMKGPAALGALEWASKNSDGTNRGEARRALSAMKGVPEEE